MDLSLKTKRILALCVCCVLLAIAIYQNIRHDDSDINVNSEKSDDSAEDVIFVQDYNSEQTGNISGDSSVSEEPVTGIDCDSPVDYIAGLRIEREANRSEYTEDCMAIIENTESSQSDVLSAQDKILSVNSMIENEDALESALKNRGYEDVFVEFSDEGNVDVVLVAKNVSESEIETIATVIYSESGISSESLTVSSVY